MTGVKSVIYLPPLRSTLGNPTKPVNVGSMVIVPGKVTILSLDEIKKGARIVKLSWRIKNGKRSAYIDRGRAAYPRKVYLGVVSEATAQEIFAEYQLLSIRKTLGIVCADCGNQDHAHAAVATEPGPTQESKSISEFVEEYLFSYGKRVKDKTKNVTYKQVSSYFLNKLIPWFTSKGITTLDQIERKTSQDIIDWLCDEYSSKSVRTRFADTKRLVTKAGTLGYISEDLWKTGYDLPELRQKQHLPLTGEELELIFNHSKYGEYYQWLYYTGKRPIDVSRLKWEDITLRGKLDSEIVIGNEKKDRDHVNGLHPVLQAKAKANKKTGPIFPHLYDDDTKKCQDKFKYAREALKKTLSNACYELVNRYGDKKTLYSLKHTSGQALSAKGRSAEDIAIHLGHSNTDTVHAYVRPDLGQSNQIVADIPTITPGGSQ
tara:strand:- start:45 stop:1340 length:1296 start_codon:yes stop_codon:yes gene_type:complete